MQHNVSNSTLIADAASYVTRQDIINFPFPTKLWLCVHLEFCDFLRWNRAGTVILLDLIALEDYLNSTRSIFKIKNRSIFLEHLDQFKFERLNATPEAEEDLLLQYQNENFQRHRLDLLAKIRRHTYQLLGEIECASNVVVAAAAASDAAAAATAQLAQARMLGDLCFMSHGGLSNIQKCRLRFQIILNFQNETRVLQDKLQASDEHAAAQAQQRRLKPHELLAARAAGGVAASTIQQQQQQQEEEQVIELPVELFENPHDSVLHLGEDFRPEYAGYYGNCSKDQIMHFFGDYLPMYEDGSMEVKKIVAEVCSTNQNCTNSDLEQSREPLQCSNEEDYKLTSTSTPIQQSKSMPSLNLSSTLEPIFKTDEDESGHSYIVSSVNLDNEADISMDEFITFKSMHEDGAGDCSGGDVKTETPNSTLKDFPQMPSAVKMEITDEDDGSENEANFRNFFSQYRASLNLLYDRH